VRISGGVWRGRNLAVPKGNDVRPTQDRVREALFSMLQGVLPGATFLDLFAGSGSVGIEALSRGAARCTFVECAPRHAACLASNLALLKADAQAEVVKADAYAWIATAGRGRAFDIVFADPPYALGVEKGYAETMVVLASADVVKPEGIFITEMKGCQDPESVPGWTLLRDRTYGQTRLAVYQRA